MLQRKTVKLGIAGSAQVQVAVCDWCGQESLSLREWTAPALGFAERPGGRHECMACTEAREWRERFPCIVDRPLRVALVGCGAAKLSHAAPAKDLYTSPLFKLSRAYAEVAYDVWFILSAKHGILSPEEEVEPYDCRLGCKESDRRRLGSLIHCGLLSRVPLGSQLYVFAGVDYADAVAMFRKHVFSPMSGLSVGQRLSWLKTMLSEVSVMGRKKSTIPPEIANVFPHMAEEPKKTEEPKTEEPKKEETVSDDLSLADVVREGLNRIGLDCGISDMKDYLNRTHPDFLYKDGTLAATLSNQKKKMREGDGTAPTTTARRTRTTSEPSLPFKSAEPTLTELMEVMKVAEKEGGATELLGTVERVKELSDAVGGLDRLLKCCEALNRMAGFFAK